MSQTANGQPTTVVQATGRVAESVIGGFSGSPALLLIVLLNVAMIVAATYFLLEANKHDYQRAIEVTQLLRSCMDTAKTYVTEQHQRLEQYGEVDQKMRERVLREHEEAEQRARAEVDRLVEVAKERLRELEPSGGDSMVRRHGAQP